jgi:hypothetical protein
VPDAERRPSRRAVLGAGVLGVLGLAAGCRPHATSSPTRTPGSGSGGVTVTPPASRPGTPSRTEQVVARVAAAETALLSAYDAAIAAFPALAPALSPLRTDHARHLAAVRPDAPTASASAASTPATSVPPGSTPASPTPTPADAVRRLASLEAAAAGDRLADLSATPANLARLVASIGGCEAAHASLLRAIA